MDFKHFIAIMFEVLRYFVIGVAFIGIMMTIFSVGGVVDLAFNEVFGLIMDEIKATMQ